MYIIVGLGNPTKQYENTRHNVGFDAIDILADRYNISVTEKKHRAYCGSGYIEGQKVLLVKPQTYMNLSGESVHSAMEFYKCDPVEELIVLCDDINLDVGQLRIRKKGSAGGHNGLKNIIAHLHTEEFQRVRIGVGHKPENYDLVDFVLGHFSKAEQEDILQGEKDAAEAVKVLVTKGIESAMNLFNRSKKQPKKQIAELGPKDETTQK